MLGKEDLPPSHLTAALTLFPKGLYFLHYSLRSLLESGLSLLLRISSYITFGSIGKISYILLATADSSKYYKTVLLKYKIVHYFTPCRELKVHLYSNLILLCYCGLPELHSCFSSSILMSITFCFCSYSSIILKWDLLFPLVSLFKKGPKTKYIDKTSFPSC